MGNEDKNALLGNAFRFSADGLSSVEFETFEPGEQTREVITNRTGTDPNHMTLSMGNHKPVDMTLGKVYRPYDSDIADFFEEWHNLGLKKSVQCDYLDPDGEAFDGIKANDVICTSVQRPKGDANADEKAMLTVKLQAPRLYPAG